VREVEIIIVGGGPAGMAAALEAAASGVETVLIDEYHTLGGQYYKQAPGSFQIKSAAAEGRQYAEGLDAISRLRASNVEIKLGSVVWGIFDERTLAICCDEHIEEMRAKKLILAPGAQEVPVAFPGWTLPGVMLGGAAQALLGSQHILPGRRVLLAGVGPLQFKVASQLTDAGAEVVEILDASSRSIMSVENALRSLGHWGKMREGLEYWLKLQWARVPYRLQHVPVRAVGQQELEAVVVARVDKDWRIVAGSERTLQVDTLCLSYGFLPSNQLSQLVGCETTFDIEAGGWVTWHDEHQETDVSGVYVAGEVGGIGGADVAAEEGRVAVMAAVRSLGKGESRGRQDEGVRSRLAKARRFAELTRSMMRLKPALFDLVTDDTIVCRCENVAGREVKAAIADGDATLRGVKNRTRAGMGRCQGRICGCLVSQMIAKETGTPLDRIHLATPRPPIKPVLLSALAGDLGR